MKTVIITKQAGEIRNRDYVYGRIESIFNTIQNGKHVLTIKKDVQKRTISQNSLMWLFFTCIEHETGTEKGEVHDYYCTKFLQHSVTINGKQKIVVSGTSKLNTAQFTDFLNKVQSDAAIEFGIKLPTPDDLEFEDFREEYEKYGMIL